ncbi:hypothetical protein [Mesorhizobium sp. CO1-1-8]|uniref:hypothetical protein n=1 Tax=Mesorhizobium sp. CO1-1-8 TaxID=2876631 RepID=UPI001CD0D931|nr:hypothetical protein [Mesorhizobium sp. CO1-1-8]MBZ9772298.1 hypothetical protein [Mesorhizobium sp. CO1-1-8]
MSDEYPGANRTVVEDEARQLIMAQIEAHNGGLLRVLRKYEPGNATRVWHGAIRALEEFINVPLFAIDDNDVVRWLLSVRLDESLLRNPARVWAQVKAALSIHVDGGTVDRICRLMVQLAAIRSGFLMHGQRSFGPGITLDTVGNAVEYLQSRRRHFVALLYLMPSACQGTEKLVALDTLNVLLPHVEHSCTTITGLYLQLALIDALPEFTLEVGDAGALGSHWLQTLDAGYLDPERASIMTMNELRRDQITPAELEVIDPRKVFSAAELRNSVKLLSATYEAFGLNDSDFAAMAAVVTSLSRRCQDDYVIAIGKGRLQALLTSQGAPGEFERLLVNRSASDYAPNTNAFEPFIDVGNAVVSNVNLLSRFLYAFKNIHLGSRRRFQIHAGFIFEDMVKRDVERLGFTITEIKRINRKEFDVVATRHDVIYNLQCKNNWIDLSKVESDRALYVRYNRKLTSYYIRALAKEERREQLLKDRLGLDRIEHRVISRFPVITTDGRIVNYNRISDLAALLGSA